MATIVRRGNGWQAKIRRRGYPPQSATFRTKTAAEAWAREIEARMDAGAYQARSREAAKLTIAEAFERYLARVTPKKRGAQRERQRIARLQARPIAQRALGNLAPDDVAEFRDALLDEGFAPNTVRLDLAALSHLFTVAASEWGMGTLGNPVKAVIKPSTAGSARERRLEDGEEARLLQAAAAGPRWLVPAIRLALATAMRRGELARLTWADVNLQRRTARLPQTKNGEARVVPLFPEAIEILQAMPRPIDGGRVIPAHPDEISRAFSAARQAAGIADLHLHDLRHEATSRLFERGDLNVMEIAAITGHKTLAMLQRYTHPRAEEIARKAAERAARAAEAIAAKVG